MSQGSTWATVQRDDCSHIPGKASPLFFPVVTLWTFVTSSPAVVVESSEHLTLKPVFTWKFLDPFDFQRYSLDFFHSIMTLGPRSSAWDSRTDPGWVRSRGPFVSLTLCDHRAFGWALASSSKLGSSGPIFKVPRLAHTTKYLLENSIGR